MRLNSILKDTQKEVSENGVDGIRWSDISGWWSCLRRDCTLLGRRGSDGDSTGQQVVNVMGGSGLKAILSPLDGNVQTGYGAGAEAFDFVWPASSHESHGGN